MAKVWKQFPVSTEHTLRSNLAPTQSYSWLLRFTNLVVLSFPLRGP